VLGTPLIPFVDVGAENGNMFRVGHISNLPHATAAPVSGALPQWRA
jgi:hypothetical protein